MAKFRMINRKPTMLVPNKSDIDLEWTNRNKINQNEPVSTTKFSAESERYDRKIKISNF